MPEFVHGRVLIALPHPTAADDLLDCALRLAHRRHCLLHALVREASELATAGALPFVQEIDRVSGARHPFDSTAAARAIASLSADCERRLRERAAAARVDVALEALHGQWFEQALAGLEAADVLLLGSHATWSLHAGRHALGLGRVGIVRDEGVDEHAARAVAADLAGQHASTPAVLESLALPLHDDHAPSLDVLVVSRRRAHVEHLALRRFLGQPRRLVVVLP